MRKKLLENDVRVIFDTASPFEAAMVDTSVFVVAKSREQRGEITFLDGKKTFIQPDQYLVEKNVFEDAVNNVIFFPSDYNLRIYNSYNNQVKTLTSAWWEKISTSKNITKNEKELKKYRTNLRAGDLTLIGLITEGGQGLATGDNGSFVGVLGGTKEAERVAIQRANKFFLFVESGASREFKKSMSQAEVKSMLDEMGEERVRQLFASTVRDFGKVFGKGFIYTIVQPEEVASIEDLTELEKREGIESSRSFVPYDKGDKEGNRWYLKTPYYINWNRENVEYLQTASEARFQNKQFYFRRGFCWSDIHTLLIKARLKDVSVYDVKSMSLFSVCPQIVSDKFLTCCLNSTFLSEYDFSFVNGTSSFQINDARQLPVVIPSSGQLADFENLFDDALEIKNHQFAGLISMEQAEEKLEAIQGRLDMMVKSLYKI